MSRRIRHGLATAALMGLVIASGFTGPSSLAADKQQKIISDAQRSADALAISNIMGRYAAYVIANKWAMIGELFALDEPDVRQSVPSPGQEGPAVRAYFAARDKEALPEGVMHQHTFLSPIIEVAGDGQTARGMWDSPGIDVANGNAMASWTWLKYAVDFKKTQQGWKIWHLRVYSVWRAPYGEGWTSMVQQASGGDMTGGAAATNVAQPQTPVSGAAAPMPPGMAAGGMAAANGTSASSWRYNGKGSPPLLPEPPKPYYTFDPNDSY